MTSARRDRCISTSRETHRPRHNLIFLCTYKYIVYDAQNDARWMGTRPARSPAPMAALGCLTLRSWDDEVDKGSCPVRF
jgi:hypothetical protein